MSRDPIETPFGILRGRDCIFLDSVAFEDRTNTLVLRGTINGHVRELATEHDPPYVLRFHGVLALRMLELDSWRDEPASSFDEVVESPWLRELGGKIDRKHRHFVLQTYDDVFDVVCVRWEFGVTDAGTT